MELPGDVVFDGRLLVLVRVDEVNDVGDELGDDGDWEDEDDFELALLETPLEVIFVDKLLEWLVDADCVLEWAEDVDVLEVLGVPDFLLFE